MIKNLVYYTNKMIVIKIIKITIKITIKIIFYKTNSIIKKKIKIV
jgi:hypothetical protein